MATVKKRAILDKNIMKKNKGIDKELVRKHAILEKQLKYLGIDTKPKFKLSPPLGSKKYLLYNH